MSEKINTDHFSTMEELLEHLKKWERDDDIDAYYRFFSPSCAFELANKIERQQKEIEEKTTIIMAGAEKVKQLEKEIEDNKKFKKDIVSKIMFWDKEELPDNEVIIEMIDTLTSEVSRLEDIEDKKVEVAIDLIEEKRDKFWQDKIREKIEHYNNELEHIKNGEEFENEEPMYYWGKAALEALLKEK